MKKNLKALMVALVVVMSVLCLCLVGCAQKTTITYMSNGQVDHTQEVEITKDNPTPTVTLPTAPNGTNAGFEFAGWYDNANFTGEPVTEQVVNADATFTFYAKWEKLYTVNFELGGGTLSSTSITGLKEGENVYEKVVNLVPTKANAEFDGWYVNGSKISSSLAISGADITLTAKYKYAYTIEIYQQNTDGTAYEKAESITGFEYAGVKYEPSVPNVPGFVSADHADVVDSIVISENTAQNVLRFYFDRKEITVTFQVDYPDGSYDENIQETLIYGKSLTVPTGYEFEGYYLLGWTNADGDVIYYTNTINSNLYNAQPTATAPDTFVPTETETYYPVWIEGYTDMFGGSDYVFLLDDNAEVCYLMRGGVWFIGDYYAEDGSFEFVINDDTYLQGVIDKTYGKMYYMSPVRAEFVAFELANNTLYTTSTISLDSGNGISYKLADENGAITESKGTYYVDEDGFYIATYTSGPLSGKTITYKVGRVSTNVGVVPAFMARNDEEANLGTLVQFVVYNGQLTYYINNVNAITFDGFGNLAYFDGSQSHPGTYTRNEDGTYYMELESGASAIIKIMEQTISGKKVTGYMFYNEAYATTTFEAEDGSTISFDGCCEATITAADGTVFKGLYAVESSDIHTAMVRVYGRSVGQVQGGGETQERLFAINVLNNHGEEIYVFEEKPVGYKEYIYMNEETLYYAPMIVLDDEVAGKANVYGYTTAGEYQKVSSGSYTFDANTGLYTYVEETAYPYVAAVFDEDEEEVVSGGVINDPVDYSLIKSFVFAVDTEVNGYAVQYWYSYTDDNNVTEDYKVMYTSYQDGKAMTLEFVSGMVIFTNLSGVKYYGQLNDELEDGTLVVVFVIEGMQAVAYFEINDEDMSFIFFEESPFIAYEMMENGTATQNVYIESDGRGNAAYYISVLDEEGEIIEETVYYGFITKLEETAPITGAPVYFYQGETEDGEEISFKYLRLAVNNNYYFTKYNERVNGTFTEKEGEGILKLDGFGYAAEYVADGTSATVQNVYMIPEENVIRLMMANGSIYFDIDLATKTFTRRGAEFGSYLLIENSMFSGIYLEFDGYGKLTVATPNEAGDDLVDIDANGTYELVGDMYVLTYVDGAQTITINGLLGYFSMNGGSYYAFYEYSKDVVTTLVNPNDWSILILDGFGFATVYDADGMIDTGRYTIVSDNTIYYFNDAETYACIYTYDIATGTAVASNFSQRGYYTSTLESLLFTEYGFAVFGGTERLYYNIFNGEVTIYRHDKDNANANEYGFVSQNFGRFSDEITYEGQKYYQNAGYALSFKRTESNMDLYPIQVGREKAALETLIFTPAGSTEFTVNGNIQIDGKAYSCVVSREINEDGVLETYVNLGMNRYTITVVYEGESNAYYTITAMNLDVKASSASWLYMRALYMAFFGVDYPDYMGQICLAGEYNERSELLSSYAYTTFMDSSEIYDYNGNIINCTNASFESTRDGLYTISFEGQDGYDYEIAFTLALDENFNVYSYTILSLSRVQVLTNGDYTVTVKRAVYSDDLSEGSVYDVIIKKGGVTYKIDRVYNQVSETEDMAKVLAVYREYDANGLVSLTKYFHLDFVERIPTSTPENDFIPVELFESFEIEEEAVNTVYNRFYDKFVDIDSNNKISLFFYTQSDGEGGTISNVYTASESTYYAENNAYIFVSGIELIALVTEDENGKLTAVIEIAEYVADPTKQDTGAYYGAETGEMYLIVYKGEVYRPDGDDNGLDKLSMTYAFTSCGKNFVVVETLNGITIEEVNYIYTSNGVDYIAISVETGDVVILNVLNRVQVATSTVYNEATGVYTITTKDATYTATVTTTADGKTVVITKG